MTENNQNDHAIADMSFAQALNASYHKLIIIKPGFIDKIEQINEYLVEHLNAYIFIYKKEKLNKIEVARLLLPYKNLDLESSYIKDYEKHVDYMSNKEIVVGILYFHNKDKHENKKIAIQHQIKYVNIKDKIGKFGDKNTLKGTFAKNDIEDAIHITESDLYVLSELFFFFAELDMLRMIPIYYKNNKALNNFAK